MTRASIGLADAFDLMERSEADPKRSYIYLQIHRYMTEGHSFSSALAKSSDSFPRKVISIIRLGEESGGLVECVDCLAKDLEAEWSAMETVKSALTYPVVVTLIALVSFGGLFAYLLPKMFELLDSLDAEIPPALAFAQSAYDYVTHPLSLFIISQLILGAYLLWRRLRANSDFMLKKDVFLANLPLVGNLTMEVNAFRFASGLKTLIIAGCPILTALKLLIPTLSNRYFSHLLGEVLHDVKSKGCTVSESMRERGLFTQPFYHMLSSGEETGKSEEVLAVIADFYRRRYEDTLTVMTALLGPTVLLGLGGAVALLGLGFFLPLMNVIGKL